MSLVIVHKMNWENLISSHQLGTITSSFLNNLSLFILALIHIKVSLPNNCLLRRRGLVISSTM